MTRKHLAKRFMKLYKMFRYKKYGEPLNEQQSVWSIHDESMMEDQMPSPLKEVNLDINSKLNEIEKYLNKDKDEKTLTK